MITNMSYCHFLFLVFQGRGPPLLTAAHFPRLPHGTDAV